MRALGMIAAIAAVMVTVIPTFIGAAPAKAQEVDIRTDRGREGIRIGPRRGPRCKTVTIKEWRDGRRVSRTIERCGGRDRD
jgi:hypothetical protein